MPEGVSPAGRIVNVPLPGDRKTFCVLGVARGGTSMVSGLLAQLGIPMGETVDDANMEDLEFTAHRGDRRIFQEKERREDRARYIEHLTRQIALRNDRHGCWGWKDPIAIHYLADIEKHLINPHYVLVTRDPGATALAEMQAFEETDPRRLLRHFRRAVDEYGRCIDFLADSDRPVLLLSYEKSLRYPGETVELCARFVLGDEARLPQEEFDRLVCYIRPERRTAQIINAMAATDPAAGSIT